MDVNVLSTIYKVSLIYFAMKPLHCLSVQIEIFFKIAQITDILTVFNPPR